MQKISKIITASCSALLLSVPFFCLADPSSDNASDEILLREEQRIQTELNALKAQLERNRKKTKTANQQNPAKDTGEANLNTVSASTKNSIYGAALNYLSGITVATSPILGLKSAWNASDMLYNTASMNEDLLLLEDRDKFNRILEASGSSLDTRPLLVFSGGIEGTTTYNKDYTDSNDFTITLSTAELDLMAIMSQWASGFMSIGFDNSAPESGARVTNSRIYLQRGFVTIGNLQQTPFYATVGQLYLPFGRYSSAMVTNPITKTIARIEERALVLGYFHDGIYFETYLDNGERVGNNPDTVFVQTGANLGYKNSNSRIGSVDVGIGYTSNIADSQGMQSNGLSSSDEDESQFAGFGKTTNPLTDNSGNNLAHNVDALDLHFKLTRGMTTLITEYITALRHFDANDLRYNGNGALVSALQAELDFNFIVKGFPLTIGTAYNQSWESLALNVPRQSYFLVASTSLWKNTVESLEYRHDVNYGVTNDTGGTDLPVPAANVGGSQDIITLRLGAYF